MQPSRCPILLRGRRGHAKKAYNWQRSQDLWLVSEPERDLDRHSAQVPQVGPTLPRPVESNPGLFSQPQRYPGVPP
jgi:hypothetical protein